MYMGKVNGGVVLLLLLSPFEGRFIQEDRSNHPTLFNKVAGLLQHACGTCRRLPTRDMSPGCRRGLS